MIVSAIAAVANNGIIGRKGDLPWVLPDDMRFFMRTTMGHHIITGRKNYESIPDKYRPLKDRVNIVVSRSPDYAAAGALLAGTLEDALELARAAGEEEVFVIGGGQVYAEALSKGLIDRLYLTLVHADVEGDTRFPAIDLADWRELSRERHEIDARHLHAFSFVVLDRSRPD